MLSEFSLQRTAKSRQRQMRVPIGWAALPFALGDGFGDKGRGGAQNFQLDNWVSDKLLGLVIMFGGWPGMVVQLDRVRRQGA